MTGWPVALLLEGIAQLSAPDPESRSAAEEGRRLVPIDESRGWGWRMVNFATYREKARLMAKSAREVATGQNKQRTAGHRRSPPVNAGERLSNANANTNTEREEGAATEVATPDGLHLPEWDRWQAYRKAIRKPIKPASVLAAQRELAGYGADQAAIVEQSIAAGWQGLFPLKSGPGQHKPEKPPSPAERRNRGIAMHGGAS